MAKPLKYTDEIDVSWSVKAIETIGVSASPDPERPIVLELEGKCPRCEHPMTDEHWLITISGVSGMNRDDTFLAVEALRSADVIKKPLLPAEFTIQCKCKEAHPDALHRTGLTGCGAVWRMRVEAMEETK
jgi:hypothetical protein